MPYRYSLAPILKSNFYHNKLVKKYQPPPEIAEIVRHWMPDASEEELKEATVNFREYLGVVYRIFLRLEAEGRLDEIRDFPEKNDRVSRSDNDQV